MLINTGNGYVLDSRTRDPKITVENRKRDLTVEASQRFMHAAALIRTPVIKAV
jgi:hypothetical protein